jgi:hypothetical protein
MTYLRSTAIRLADSSRTSPGIGTFTSRIPSLYEAAILDSSTPSGNGMDLAKEPQRSEVFGLRDRSRVLVKLIPDTGRSHTPIIHDDPCVDGVVGCPYYDGMAAITTFPRSPVALSAAFLSRHHVPKPSSPTCREFNLQRAK